MYVTLQVLTLSPPVSPLVTVSATLYAPLSALLHGYRNTKVKRELCQMLGVTSPRSGQEEKLFSSLTLLFMLLWSQMIYNIWL